MEAPHSMLPRSIAIAVDHVFPARPLVKRHSTANAKSRTGRLPLRGMLACIFACSLSIGSTVNAADRAANEPGWIPNIVAFGELREQIEATPIENRPYRPLHFYGNTVRRIHYHGSALPRLGDGAGSRQLRVAPRRARGVQQANAQENRASSR